MKRTTALIGWDGFDSTVQTAQCSHRESVSRIGQATLTVDASESAIRFHIDRQKMHRRKSLDAARRLGGGFAPMSSDSTHRPPTKSSVGGVDLSCAAAPPLEETRRSVNPARLPAPLSLSLPVAGMVNPSSGSHGHGSSSRLSARRATADAVTSQHRDEQLLVADVHGCKRHHLHDMRLFPQIRILFAHNNILSSFPSALRLVNLLKLDLAYNVCQK